VIPVAVVTGPGGVGKSTVLHEADQLLHDAGVRHATVELEEIARFWPRRTDEHAHPHIGYRNLASVWANYHSSGADRMLLGLLLERRSELLPLYDAIPGAEVRVVRLHAPLLVIERRLRMREPYPEPELSAARWWSVRVERSAVADHVVDNSRRPPRDVAAEMLRLLGWL
jgi:hypothetical protein